MKSVVPGYQMNKYKEQASPEFNVLYQIIFALLSDCGVDDALGKDD